MVSIVTLLVAIGAPIEYIVLNLFVKRAKKQLKEEAVAWINSEIGQKAIFSIGALAGQGAKTGFGISKTGGKFNIQSIIAQIAGNYLERQFNVGSPAQTAPQQPLSTSLE